MTNQQRAVQMWSVLIFAARNQQILSYTMLSQFIGVPPYGLANILGMVQEYCKRHDLPSLTAIVVNEKDGLPGHLYPGHQGQGGLEVLRDQSRVFVFDWNKHKFPSADDFSVPSVAD